MPRYNPIGDFDKYVRIMCAKATAMLGVLGVELEVLWEPVRYKCYAASAIPLQAK